DEIGSQLSVASSGPMIWTSYRDIEGNLIIELPNSKPSAEVASLELEDKLVASAHVQVEESGDRPLTRLVVRTRNQAEHSVTADGTRLLVDLMPVAGARGATTDNVVADYPVDVSTNLGQGGVDYEPVSSIADSFHAPVENLAMLEVDSPSASALASATPGPQMGPSPSGVPATQLKGIEVATSSGATTVWIQGDGAFYYSTFGLDDPHRFVVDLIGVVNTSPVSTVAVATALVDGVRVAQFKPQPELVARVVIDLLEETVPAIEASDDGLKLIFDQSAPSAPAAEADPPAESQIAEVEPEPEWVEADLPEKPEMAETMPADMQEETESEWENTEEAVEIDELSVVEIVQPTLEDVEPAVVEPAVVEPAMAEAAEEALEEVFAPTMEMEAETVAPAPYEAPEPETEVEAYEAYEPYEPYEPEPVAEIAQLPPPESLEPAADVSLFDVAQIDLDTEPAGAPEGLEASYESRDLTDTVTSGYEGEPLTMTLREADIKDVLRSFAQISGLNVVVQPGVEGSVTVELTDVPWDQALDIILKTNGLNYQLEGNIMRIAPVEVLRAEAEEEQRLEAAKALSIPLKTVMQRVSYASANDIASVLEQGAGSSLMTARGSVVVDTRTNTLIIKELPSNLNTVLAVIESLDIPEPQVMIEARIIETTKRFSRSLGIAWGFTGVADAAHGNTTGLVFPNNIDAAGSVNLLTGGSNGFLDISLGNVLNTFNLDVVLQAAENEGLINVLSAPKIATLNNHPASIQSGLQIPIQTIANNTVSVQFVNATLRLEVTPHVTAEGTVLMDIDIQKREPQLAFAVAGATNAPIATRDASTRVIVRDGGTAVIGGIYEVSSDQGEDRVPGLANVPLIKHLFKNKRRTDENEELLIFITPRIVRL
ncbi:MAG: type IV pilus secretin PilQ, partial [Acidimicrobiia bacterium]|nr:type IV pilus secretin PilQ [Acidimicrobiia bacterium]